MSRSRVSARVKGDVCIRNFSRSLSFCALLSFTLPLPDAPRLSERTCAQVNSFSFLTELLKLAPVLIPKRETTWGGSLLGVDHSHTCAPDARPVQEREWLTVQ